MVGGKVGNGRDLGFGPALGCHPSKFFGKPLNGQRTSMIARLLKSAHEDIQRDW